MITDMYMYFLLLVFYYNIYFHCLFNEKVQKILSTLSLFFTKNTVEL